MSQEQKLEKLAELLKEVLSEKNQDISFLELAHLKFTGEGNGRGLIWPSKKHNRQFVFYEGPDRFLSTESIDLSRDKHISINGVKVLDEKELGLTVTKSNLREVGPLKGLIVDGSLSVNDFLYYDALSNKFGVGTTQPHATVGIVDKGVEINLGSSDGAKASIGVYNSKDLELTTDNTARITIKAGGAIELGNKNNTPTSVTVHGNLSVNVNVADPRADVHINGAIKFNDTLHMKSSGQPESGTFKQGDIVWNANPQPRHFIGWVCVQSGTPGVWAGFGEIR